MDEHLQAFQPGDVIEVVIPIDHVENLRSVKANFVHERWPRDVVQWYDVEADLVRWEPGRTVATFRLHVEGNYQTGEYKMGMLRAATYAGFTAKIIEDAPVVQFSLIQAQTGDLRADGFEMRKA